jgi:hypothetical protein
MVLSMDEIINAICMHIAERKAIRPMDVQVELSWDEESGYSAEVWAQARSQFLVESNLIEAILRYLQSEYNVRAFRDQVTLDIDDEITANIVITS